MKIRNFKRGDVVTRTKPSKSIGDRSYIGDRLVLSDIVNGQIYLQRTNDRDIRIFGNSPISLSEDEWSRGWTEYVSPSLFKIEFTNGIVILIG